MRKIIVLFLIFLTFGLFAQKNIPDGDIGRYSISPTAFGLKQGELDLSLNGPFLNQIFFNIQNRNVSSSYMPSNFYSLSFGLTNYLSTSIGFNPAMMFYNGMLFNNDFRYLPLYTNTKLHFKIGDNIRLGTGLFTFNLPNQGEQNVYSLLGGYRYTYVSNILWDFIPVNSTINSSFIILPYGIITFGNKRNNISLLYSPYNVLCISGKIKLSDKFNLMSENFFINPQRNNINYNILMFGYITNSNNQINSGLMYIGSFYKQNKFPLMLCYSVVYKIDKLKDTKYRNK